MDQPRIALIASRNTPELIVAPPSLLLCVLFVPACRSRWTSARAVWQRSFWKPAPPPGGVTCDSRC
jgi:hypothetical protein